MITTQEIAFKIGRLIALLDSLLHSRTISRLGSIMVLCDNYRKGTSPTTDAIRDYHQSDSNTVLRVGDTSSDLSKAGLYHCTTAAESTPGSHGEGTAYCGRIYLASADSSRPYYWYSTGIGTVQSVTGVFKSVQSECRSEKNNYDDYAHCGTLYPTGNCPLGWGNRKSHAQYLPGCHAGTYYPSPTRPTSTNVNTGSRKCKNRNYPSNGRLPRS